MSDPSPSSAALVPLAAGHHPAPPTTTTITHDYNKGNWSVNETLILITAKRLDDERRQRGDRPTPPPPSSSSSAAATPPSQRPAEQRWKWVENYCRHNGCQRSQNQCNDKWDNLLRDYKKVRAYESRATSGDTHHPSYWSMDRHERKDRNLPTNLAAEVFDALTDVLSRRTARRGGGTAATPISCRPPISAEQQASEPPPRPAAEQRPARPSVSVENMSESSDDTDADECEQHDTKRRKSRRLGSSVVRGASVLARAMLACEERRERRHRDHLELEERRLRLESDRNEMGRQGFAGLIAAVSGLSGAIHALASSSSSSPAVGERHHHRRNSDDSK